MKKYFSHAIYPILILIFLALLFALKSSAVFHERQALEYGRRAVKSLTLLSPEILKTSNFKLIDRAVSTFMKSSPIVEVRIFKSHRLVYQKDKTPFSAEGFLFLTSPLPLEQKAGPGNPLSRIRVLVDCNKEVKNLRYFALILFLTFLAIAGALILIVRLSSARLHKELSMIESSIEKEETAEILQTREFNIQELAMFQRKIKNDSRDMKFLKEELRKKENLALIGNFASSIVHDIRNPLGVIEGYTEMIKINTGEEKFTSKILSSTGMIARLLEDILTFLREQKVELQIDKYNPTDVVALTLEMLRTNYTRRNITVVEKIDYREPIVCDMDRLSRALMNLVKNSVDLSKSGDEVVVRVFEQEKAVL
ncbi:MAG: HAMP domain-containing histidine kinase, partial [bacterium]|nr:HAMP domain-containing histidine kinase [bacterium]